MYKALTVALGLSLAATGALAEAPGEKLPGTASADYQWNAPGGEASKALRLAGDVKAGQEDYTAYCAACHRPNGGGDPDGSIPKLAGQHPSVVVKQLADIRSGLRDNPTMLPFAVQLRDAQALANVAAYIATLCIPRESGIYQAPDAANLVAYGQQLYDKDCSQCHQPNGYGVNEKLYPVIAGQHYPYLLRQMIEIRDGKRRNTHPDMVRVISKYQDAELVAIAAYQSTLATQVQRLTLQPRFCNPS
ncbi:MAG: c-type cytochrome [Rhodobacteraceae bacterium]|nr:c-type cytochrome [Paracoccaceae bacterium]